jgi:hypothetical protein
MGMESFVAYLCEAPGELVIASLVAGLIAACFELRAAIQRAGH